MVFSQPFDGGGDGGEPFATHENRIIPGEPGLTEGVVLIEELCGGNVLDDIADGAATTWRDPYPVFRCDGLQVAKQRMPFRAVEGPIEKVEDLGDAAPRWWLWLGHDAYYTANLVRQVSVQS